ncbi:MAG: T9SS type A sorting domain-containing protein [Bacteroidota bacterium]
MAFTIDGEDLLGNSITRVTVTTDSSSVTYDHTAPVLLPADSTITNIAENDSVATLLTVSATDAFAVTFSGADGTDQHYFSISTTNSTTGEFRWDNFSPDYEQPQDANGDNAYWGCLTVADEAGNTTSHCYRFDIQDVSEPSSFRIDTVADVVIAENVVYTSETPRISGEAPIGSINWSLGGADAAVFTIAISAGVVTLIAQDYESPSDANKDNAYEVKITATDADGNDAHESWTVIVTDVLERTVFYPNPASTVLNIKNAASYVKISILDLKGREVEYTQLSTDKFDVSGISAGFYMLEIQTRYGFKKRFKLRIQR